MSDQLRGLMTIFLGYRTIWSSFDGARIQAAFLLPRGEGVAHAIKGSAMDEGDRSLSLKNPLALK